MSTFLRSTDRLDPTPPAPSPLRRVLARHQVPVFVALTLLLSWAFIPVADGGLLPHGPMIAALIVLALVIGRRGVAELGRQLVRWRVPWAWYLVAPGLFLAMHGAALAVAGALGVERSATGPALSAGAWLAIWLPLVLVGGQWEEPGWLGYLTRRLQDLRHAPLLVLLVAGLVRVAWHTPLVLAGTIPWYDFALGIFALQIILMWLYNRTGGSLLIPMICHLFSNLTLATVLPLLAEADRGLYWLVFSVIEAAVGLGIVLATRGRLGRRPGPRARRGAWRICGVR
jgi:hypothetical protein